MGWRRRWGVLHWVATHSADLAVRELFRGTPLLILAII
jgi:hypothetical protein